MMVDAEPPADTPVSCGGLGDQGGGNPLAAVLPAGQPHVVGGEP